MRIKHLALCALFVTLSAALAQLAIPIGPVPVTMTFVSIFLAAGLLGFKYGTLSQAVYVLMGAAGLPVFSRFSGGLGVILGPTGGFILGYVCCAALSGYLIERYNRQDRLLPVFLCAGVVATYIPGTIWYMYVTGTGAAAALSACVAPFIPGDIIKIVMCTILIKRLRPVILHIM